MQKLLIVLLEYTFYYQLSIKLITSCDGVILEICHDLMLVKCQAPTRVIHLPTSTTVGQRRGKKKELAKGS